MDPVKQALLRLVHPAREGDPVLRGVKLVRITTDFGMRMYLETVHGEFVVDIKYLEPNTQFAAATQHLSLSYRRASGTHGTHGAPGAPAGFGKALCEALAGVLKHNEAAFLQQIDTHEATVQAHPEQDRKLREVTVTELLERLGPAGQHFWALNPYAGCLVGCTYCYAQEGTSHVRRSAGVTARKWGSWVDVRMNAHEVLAREIAELPPLPIKFAPITTDPYHAVEERYEITRKCLTVLRDARYAPAVMLLTRTNLIRRDVDLFTQLSNAVPGVSLPSHDEDVLRHFEPRGATAKDRVETLALLKRTGLPSIAVVQPLLYCNVSSLADVLAENASSVRIAPLEGVYGAVSHFAHPIYRVCADPSWQRDQIARLVEALTQRNVPIWTTEFPPEARTA